MSTGPASAVVESNGDRRSAVLLAMAMFVLVVPQLEAAAESRWMDFA